MSTRKSDRLFSTWPRTASRKEPTSLLRLIVGRFWPGIRAGYWGRSSVTTNHGALSKISACASGRTPGSSSSVARRDAIERHGARGGLSAARAFVEFHQHRCAALLYRIRDACPVSTRKTRQARRRREIEHRLRRPAPACGMPRHVPSGTAGDGNARIASGARQSRSAPHRTGNFRAARSSLRVLGLLVEHVTAPRLIADHWDLVGLGHGFSWHSQASSVSRPESRL